MASCATRPSASSSSRSTCCRAPRRVDNVALPLVYRGCRAAASAGSGRRRCSDRVGLGTGSTTGPTRSPAASSSGWRSPARWSPSRGAAGRRADRQPRHRHRRGGAGAAGAAQRGAGWRWWWSPTTARSPARARRQITMRDGLIVPRTPSRRAARRLRARRGLAGRAGRAAGQPAAQRADHARRDHRGRPRWSLLVAIGTGTKQQVEQQVEGLGSNLLLVVPGQVEPRRRADRRRR